MVKDMIDEQVPSSRWRVIMSLACTDTFELIIADNF